MPKSKKSDKADVDTQPLPEQTMFPAIGNDTQTASDGPDDEFLPGYKTKEDALKAFENLKGERDKFASDLDAMRRAQDQMQVMLDQLIASGKPSSEPKNEPQPIDLSKLPDPVEDREGFARGVMNIVADFTRQNVSALQSQTSRQQRLEKLWNTFKDEHEDLAEYPELVEAATREVVGELQARGVDAERFMFGNQGRFMDMVAKKTEGRLEKFKERLGIKGGENEDDDLRGGRLEPSRDLGLSNGSRGQPTHSPSGGEKLGSLVSDLKKLQRTSGFF